jgi:hypothetical protein
MTTGGSAGAGIGGSAGDAGAGGEPACECVPGSGYPAFTCRTEPEHFCIRGNDYPPAPPPVPHELSCPLVVDELLQHRPDYCVDWGPWNYSECDDGTVRMSWYGWLGETRIDLVFDARGTLIYGRGDGFVGPLPCGYYDPYLVTAGSPTPAGPCRTCALCGGRIDGEGEGGAGGAPDVVKCAVDANGRVSLPP